MIDKLSQKKLKMLIGSEHWDVIPVLFEEVIKKWNDVPVKGETEWETLWSVAEKQGKIDGLREFINNCEEIANEN